MRMKTLIFLAILCAIMILFMMGIMEKKMQEECSVLETEIMLLQIENVQLLDLIAGLREGESAGPGQCQVVRQR